MNTISTILIDDEQSNRENLAALLSNYCPNIGIIAQADSVSTAFTQIRKHNPQLIFLDIKLYDRDGFELLEQFDSIHFEVIFVTAYNEFALKAIKFCALDYLLKPIDIVELTKAVDKATKRISDKSENIKLREFLENQNQHAQNKRIALPQFDKIEFVYTHEIIRIESDNNYSRVCKENGKCILVAKTLKEFDDLLCEFGFLRVHRSHLINRSHIKSYRRHDGSSIVMSDNQVIPVSRQKHKEVLEQIRAL